MKNGKDIKRAWKRTGKVVSLKQWAATLMGPMGDAAHEWRRRKLRGNH